MPANETYPSRFALRLRQRVPSSRNMSFRQCEQFSVATKARCRYIRDEIQHDRSCNDITYLARVRHRAHVLHRSQCYATLLLQHGI